MTFESVTQRSHCSVEVPEPRESLVKDRPPARATSPLSWLGVVSRRRTNSRVLVSRHLVLLHVGHPALNGRKVFASVQHDTCGQPAL